MKQTKYLNLFAGPGSGKSTTAAGIFHHLKIADVKCELITEVAKDVNYEENSMRMSNQIYLLGEQYHRQIRVRDKVDFAITDSPILLGINYRPPECPIAFNDLCFGLFNQFDNINYFIKRTKKYQAYGRSQTEDEARRIDDNIHNILHRYGIKFKEIDGDMFASQNIIRDICTDGIVEFCFDWGEE